MTDGFLDQVLLEKMKSPRRVRPLLNGGDQQSLQFGMLLFNRLRRLIGIHRHPEQEERSPGRNGKRCQWDHGVPTDWNHAPAALRQPQRARGGGGDAPHDGQVAKPADKTAAADHRPEPRLKQG